MAGGRVTNFKPVSGSQADAFVACVTAAGEVRDRLREAAPAVIAGRRVKHVPAVVTMSTEQRREAGRKGGQKSKTPVRHPERNAEIVRLRREEGFSFGKIARRLGVSRSLVSGVCNRAGCPPLRGIRISTEEAAFAKNPETGRQVRGFAAMSADKHREIVNKANEALRSLAVKRRVERVLAGSDLPRAARATSARVRYGFTPEEFSDYGIIRAKGFSQAEAAEIVLRSRRPSPKAGEGA